MEIDIKQTYAALLSNVHIGSYMQKIYDYSAVVQFSSITANIFCSTSDYTVNLILMFIMISILRRYLYVLLLLDLFLNERVIVSGLSLLNDIVVQFMSIFNINVILTIDVDIVHT